MPADVPARQALLEALQPLAPEDWQWVTDEADRDDTRSGTRVWISQRTIKPHPQAPKSMHLIGFTITVAVPQTDLAAAERQLDDDIEAFLWTLDQNRIGWGTATKGNYDGRLGYQLDVDMQSHRRGPEE